MDAEVTIVGVRALVALLFAVCAVPAHGAAIEWSKSGGFAGVSHELRVRADRTAIADGAQRRISARRYRRLRALLDDAGFTSLKPRYPAPGAADTFEYRVRYRGHTVVADQTKVPRRLWPALDALQRLYDDVRGTSRFTDAQEAALAAARRKWRNRGYDSYDFRLTVYCFCPGGGVPRTVRVRDGRVTNRREDGSFLVDSVPRMFREIARVLASPRAGEVDVTYHPVLGYPVRASLDRIEAAIDDEISWRVKWMRNRGR
jgi:hypothetical protein